MKALLFSVCMITCASICLAENPREIRLWPEGMPEPVVPSDPPEKVEFGKDGIQRRYNVSDPRLIVSMPPENVTRSGSAIIIVPGGGFTKLADGHEGSEAASWLAQQGVVAFTLEHRTPTHQHTQPNQGPIQDVQKAVMEVRKRAEEFRLTPRKIGVLGFSAGGQAALIAATNPPEFSHDPILSHRPDLLLLLYPYQIYDSRTHALRSEIRLDANPPPTFIAQMGDDTASLAQGSLWLYLGLIERKIPAEIHVYQAGGHGFGMRSRPGVTGPTDWQHEALNWLRLQEFIAPQESSK